MGYSWACERRVCVAADTDFFITGDRIIYIRSVCALKGHSREKHTRHILSLLPQIHRKYKAQGAVKAIETCLRCIMQYLVFFSIAQLKQDFLWIWLKISTRSKMSKLQASWIYKRCLFLNFQNNALFRLYGVLFLKREITLLNNKNVT